MRSSRDAHPRATSAVPSLEPSSTTIASQRSSVCATRDPSAAPTVASTSKAGITTETATRLRSIPTVGDSGSAAFTPEEAKVPA